MSNDNETQNQINFTVTLHKTKETKGTVRFDSKDENPLIRTIYVSKDAFPEGVFPDCIDLTVDDDVALEDAEGPWEPAASA